MILDSATFFNHVKEGSDLFDGPDTAHSCFRHLCSGLVAEFFTYVAVPEHEKTVVTKVLEVLQNQINRFIFTILEESGVLVLKLVDQLVQKVHRILLVLGVSIRAADYIHDPCNHIWLRQCLEARLIFGEVAQGLRSIQRHV